MPQPTTLAKAQLIPVTWSNDGRATPDPQGKSVSVQFNPETLTVTHNNQISSGDQRNAAVLQFVGGRTSKLALDLWFDATVSDQFSDNPQEADVRRMTEEVHLFLRAEGANGLPPGMRFLWGTFLFDGVLESLTEKLEFFSAEGKPLRAVLGLSLVSPGLQHFFADDIGSDGRVNADRVGTAPRQPAAAGDTIQGMAAAQGQQGNWQDIARANNVENPRQLTPGQEIDMRAR